jgi:hypothetical protein
MRASERCVGGGSEICLNGRLYMMKMIWGQVRLNPSQPSVHLPRGEGITETTPTVRSCGFRYIQVEIRMFQRLTNRCSRIRIEIQ